jgi:ribonuclease Z
MHFSISYRGKSPLLYEELKAPPGVTLLRLPEHLPPRPLLAAEIPKLQNIAKAPKKQDDALQRKYAPVV